MKYIFPILLLVLFISCKNNNDKYLSALNETNKYLVSEVDILKHKLYMESQDRPHHYDTVFTDTFAQISKEIHNLENYTSYAAIYKKIEALSQKRKFNLKFQQITESEIDILKSNLYINLMKLGHFFQFRTNYFLAGTHCGPGYIFKRYKKSLGDSIHLDIRFPNQYNVVTDSIVDDKGNKIKFSDTTNLTIGTVKYRFPSEKTVTYYGKIFYHNDNGDVLLLKTIADTVSSPYFKYYNK